MNQGYKDLIVWQKAMTLVKLLYKITEQLPKNEQFILIPQMLRAGISIPSNIAEGWSRNRKLEFARFFEIAFSSCSELETQLLICKDQYAKVDYQQAEAILVEVKKMLITLIRNHSS
jgi:four helix bundle protein